MRPRSAAVAAGGSGRKQQEEPRGEAMAMHGTSPGPASWQRNACISHGSQSVRNPPPPCLRAAAAVRATAPARQTTGLPAVGLPVVAVLVAVAAALLGYHYRAGLGGGFGPSVLTPLKAPRLTELPEFGGAYRDEMLWGSYRSGLYFGMRTRRAAWDGGGWKWGWGMGVGGVWRRGQGGRGGEGRGTGSLEPVEWGAAWGAAGSGAWAGDQGVLSQPGKQAVSL